MVADRKSVGLTKGESEEIVRNLQVAHRLITAFNDRMLAMLDEYARQLDLEFWYWSPEETWRPPQQTVRPGSRSAWDFDPLYSSLHVYRRARSEFVSKGDICVAFVIHIEDTFSSSGRGANRGHPDPLKMREGDAVIQIYLYRVKRGTNEAFDTVWDGVRWVEERDVWEDARNGFEGILWERSLADILANPQLIIELLGPDCGKE